jgi:transposase
MATISEAAKFVGVGRDSVKQWATEFAEYLSLTANPGKGKERKFMESDVRVLAVIAHRRA